MKAPLVMSEKIISQALQVATSQEWLSYWRKSNNGKKINQYQSGRWTPVKHIIKQDEPYLVAFLINYLNIDIQTAMNLTTIMNGLIRKADDDKSFTDGRGDSLCKVNNRYGLMTKTYNNLDAQLQSLLFEEATVGDRNVIIYRRNNDAEIHTAMTRFAMTLTATKGSPIHDDEKGYKESDLVMVKINGFSKMDLGGKCQVIKSFVKSQYGKMYIKLSTQRDYGNYGRTYNILDSFSRNNRQHIELYGYDLEAALQSIWVSLVGHKIDLSTTSYYIHNKHDMRDEVSELMKWSVPRTKMELTAIYQGRHFNKKKYLPLEGIFDEVKDLRTFIMDNLRGDGSVADKYATKKTDEKLAKTVGKTYDKKIHCVRGYNKLNTKMKDSLANTYMFFYWTYYEGMIQQVVAKLMNDTNHTVHDGIYVQHEWDIYELTADMIEDEILKQTGIEVKLGAETSTAGKENQAERSKFINEMFIKHSGLSRIWEGSKSA